MSKKKNTKVNKLIGLTPENKKALTLMAADVGISLKAYCERILDRHVVTYAKPEEINTPKMLTKEECFIKPVAIEVNFSNDEPAIVHNLETGKKTKLKKETPKTDSIPAQDKKGNFERIENNIYSNGKVFEYRSYTQKDGKVSVFCKTLKEAQELKGE